MQQGRTWERQLLAMAYEASMPTSIQLPRLIGDQSLLQRAYAHCDRLTAQHSRSFHLASRWLSPAKKQAVRALYAFCRVTDDIVDRNPQSAAPQLQRWQAQIFAQDPPKHDLVAVAWADTRTRHHMPPRYSEQLFDGVARDLRQTRYQNFADLATYAYSVAATVGLMSMHIIGSQGQEAIPYAIKLGLALQLTNILRDVGEDWHRGRVYLPQDELAAFGLSEGVIADGRVTQKWRDFMRFQIERNRLLYQESWAGIGLLNEDGRFAIAAAAGLYRAILEDIEAHDYDVFNRRAFVGRWGKVRRLPRLWWQSRHI